ncbi:VWA domain-containing protein [Porticoccaceae bacterium LTM1]|nr:VWA domain-containing protein [Porticoccaceae bacterium LTM1]
MTETGFHLLRPLWLLAIPVGLLLLWWLRSRSQSLGNWAKVINPRWLPLMLDSQQSRRRNHSLLWGIGIIATSIGLSGPTWQQLPLPVHKEHSALVIALDLSPSMWSTDLKPSRLTRARYKLTDILKARTEGVTALLVYGGTAHMVTPLTDDTDTIIAQIPVLDPSLIATPGSNTEDAISLAQQLLRDGGHATGDILLITDEVTEQAQEEVSDLMRSSGYRLSILGVGTPKGAPIPLPDGGFAKDSRGTIVVASLDQSALLELAHRNGGQYSDLSADSSDLNYLLNGFGEPINNNTERLEREFDSWDDQGFWMAIVLLPLVIAAFRKGMLAVLLLAPILFSEPAAAFDWKDLWKTPNQQGQQAFEKEQFENAQQTFKDPNWKGAAAYRNGDYETALSEYQKDNSAAGLYNQGNALAQLQRLEEAIEAYKKALKKEPGLADAEHNKKLLEDLLKKQQEQQQDQSQSENGENQQNQDQNQSDSQSQDSSGEDSSDENSSGGESSKQNSSESEQESSSENSSNSQQQSDSSNESQQQDSTSQRKENQGGEQQDANQENGEEEEEQQEKQQQGQPGEPESGDEQQQQANAAESEETPEQKEARNAMEQFLRKVPDDPGAFLRRKFNYQKNNRQRDEHRRPPQQDEQRW